MHKICEILEIKKDLCSDEIKLLIGDMEMAFEELMYHVKYINKNESFCNKKFGEVIAYLNCLNIFRIIDKKHIEKMDEILSEIDELQSKKV